MTRQEAQRLVNQEHALLDVGFTRDEAEQLRRISMTLHRWSEHECNGTIQREGENGDGAPYAYNPDTGRKGGKVADRERGALERLKTILGARNARFAPPRRVSAYVQGDPRGCALYILRPGDVPAGADDSAYYSRGIAVY